MLNMFKSMKILILLVAVFILGISTNQCQRLNYLPMPKSILCNQQNTQPSVLEDPCRILYHVKNVDDGKLEHFKQLIKDQQLKTFKCKMANLIFGPIENVQIQGIKYTITIEVEKPQLRPVFTTKEQAYSLNITQSQSNIKSQTFVGLVRGLQTCLQSFQCPKLKYKKCAQHGLPIVIQDEPAFIYRGLMVDTSRHFLPVHLLYETIDAMMYNKLSVFHWHITDEDAFPLILDSHPEIAQYGAFSEEETYTAAEARDLVRYAMVRGVRVVPELDTPGHAASWGKAPQNNGTACTFGSGYMGPLDVTLDKTYTLVKQVFAQILDIFPDPIVHLGGDQVVLTCLQNKTEFMNKQKVSERDIERHYRRKQHKIIKELDPKRTPMYWMNSQVDIEQGDIVHWWGGGNPRTKNPVVLSNYGPFYLDMGVGNYFGVSYGSYITWLDLYNQHIERNIQGYDNKANVMGAQVCLWSEINNRYTHHMKIWIRSSSLAERVWNTENFNPKPDFFKRITAHERLMNRRGIPTAPATCQQCESHPQFC